MLNNYKYGYFVSDVYPRWSMERRQAEGQPETKHVLRAKTQALLSDLPVPEDYNGLIEKGETYIQSLFENRNW